MRRGAGRRAYSASAACACAGAYKFQNDKHIRICASCVAGGGWPLTGIIGDPALVEGDGRRAAEDVADVGIRLDGHSAAHDAVVVQRLHASAHEVIKHHGNEHLLLIDREGAGDAL